MQIVNNVIKLSYLNTPKFKELTSEEKDRFEYRFDIIHSNLPVNRNLSPSLNKIINNGLFNLIKDNREGFISGLYARFVDQLVIKMGTTKMLYRKSSYNSAYNFKNQNDFYTMFPLFISYFESMRFSDIGLVLPILEIDDNYTFYQIWNIYNTLYQDYKDDFFNADVIRYIFIYFLSHNELIKDNKLFYDTVKRFGDDKALADYYRMNYYHNQKDIPEDLIKRYNEENKKIIR